MFRVYRNDREEKVDAFEIPTLRFTSNNMEDEEEQKKMEELRRTKGIVISFDLGVATAMSASTNLALHMDRKEQRRGSLNISSRAMHFFSYR